MREWAKSAGNLPQWTMETKLKMMEIYSLLEDRIEKNTQWGRLWGVTCRLMKMERVETTMDFATEFTSLTTTVLSFFAPGALSIVDLQREFELAAHDEELCTVAGEELCTVAGEGENDKEENAVITAVEEAIPADEGTAIISVMEETPKKSATAPKSAPESENSSIRNWKGITVVVIMYICEV